MQFLIFGPDEMQGYSVGCVGEIACRVQIMTRGPDGMQG